MARRVIDIDLSDDESAATAAGAGGGYSSDASVLIAQPPARARAKAAAAPLVASTNSFSRPLAAASSSAAIDISDSDSDDGDVLMLDKRINDDDDDDELPDLVLAARASRGSKSQNKPRARGLMSTSTSMAPPTRVTAPASASHGYDYESREYGTTSRAPAPALDKGKGKAVSDRPIASTSYMPASTTYKKKSKCAYSRDAEKEAKKAAALEEKRRKSEEAQRVKDARRRFTEANIRRDTKRKETVRELSVHIGGLALAAALEPEGTSGKRKKNKPSPWLAIASKFEASMRAQGVEVSNHGADERHALACDGVVRWRRICTKRWDEHKRVFEPLEPPGRVIVVEESSRVIFMDASEVCALVEDKGYTAVRERVQRIRDSLRQPAELFVLVHGLQAVWRKHRNAENRDYLADVRQSMVANNVTGDGGAATATASSKRSKSSSPGPEQQQAVEYALMRMQLALNVRVIHVERDDDAVTWLENLSMDVSNRPYQRQKSTSTDLLGLTEEKIVCGADPGDTFEKMLASIRGVTIGAARGIRTCYPTVRALYEAWEACASEAKARSMLAGLPIMQNSNGGATNRHIGPGISQRVWEILTGADPSAWAE